MTDHLLFANRFAQLFQWVRDYPFIIGPIVVLIGLALAGLSIYELYRCAPFKFWAFFGGADEGGWSILMRMLLGLSIAFVGGLAMYL